MNRKILRTAQVVKYSLSLLLLVTKLFETIKELKL
jgi:hypothetical protein